MGSPVATQLARHGVATRGAGRLRLIDGDRVSLRNLVGTEYRHEHIGMPKAEAAAGMIRECNNEANVSYWNKMLGREDVRTIRDLAWRSDLLGLFADSFELMLEIAHDCREVCPQVMAVFGPNADYAEVAFSIPGSTRSLSKTMGKRKRKTIAEPQALGCDTLFIASFVVSVCLRLLLGKAKGTALMPCYANTPLFLVGLRRTWIFSDQPEDVARCIVYVQA